MTTSSDPTELDSADEPTTHQPITDKSSEEPKKTSPFGTGINFGAKWFGTNGNVKGGAPKGGFNKQRPGRGAARGR